MRVLMVSRVFIFQISNFKVLNSEEKLLKDYKNATYFSGTRNGVCQREFSFCAFSFVCYQQASCKFITRSQMWFFQEEASNICVTRFEARYSDINYSHVTPLPRTFVTFLLLKKRDHRYGQIVGSFIRYHGDCELSNILLLLIVNKSNFVLNLI